MHPHADVLAHVTAQSGEGRFRWLHARPGRARALREAAEDAPRPPGLGARPRGGRSRSGWLGPKVSEAAAARLGDVALAAQGTLAFHDPADTGPFRPDRPARLADPGRDAGAAAGRLRLLIGAPVGASPGRARAGQPPNIDAP